MNIYLFSVKPVLGMTLIYIRQS